jgi:hypothetical protein
MSSIIRATTTSGLQIAPDNSGSLQLQTNGTTAAVTIDTSQNVGIGITTPSSYAPLTVRKYLTSGSQNNVASFSDAVNATLTLGFTSGYANFICDNGQAFYTSNTERMRIDSSGNLQFNSGYGSVATAYGCRAWVNFNGTGTVAIRGSGNVSSITDNGTGDYTVNFTNAMPDSNYSVGGSAYGNIAQLIMSPFTTMSTTQCRVITSNTTALADNSIISVQIFR